MKRFTILFAFCSLVAGLVYAATHETEVIFDAPVARPSVASIRVKFLQVDFDNRTVEAFYVVQGNGGQINSAVLFSGDEFVTFPQPGNTLSNLLTRASARLRQMGATNGISLK